MQGVAIFIVDATSLLLLLLLLLLLGYENWGVMVDVAVDMATVLLLALADNDYYRDDDDDVSPITLLLPP